MGIIFEKDGHIAKVGLDTPETRNALGPDTLKQLYEAWQECGNDHQIRVAVFYSALDDIFCSGMDLKTVIPVLTGMRKPQTDDEEWLVSNWQAVSEAMLKTKQLDRPVIAAVHGYCLTGGFEMAMGCELRVASEDAVFQMRETKLGIMPTGGSNVFLPAQVGSARAMEILLTGENFPASKLYEWGFLNRLVPREKLMNEAMSLAETIAGNGPESVRAMVRCSRQIQGKSLEEAFETETRLGGPVFVSDDAKEGVKAQKEKRKPDFK